MKRFLYAAVLSIALAMSPVAVLADDVTAPPPVLSEEEESPVEKETAPVLDLAFCVDVSGSMNGYMPVIKATILSLIQRAMRQHPGHTVRLGLVRYGDGAKRYFVLDLDEDQNRFLKHLQDTKSDAAATEFVGDVVKKSAEELTWSKDAAERRLYVIGNESARQGPISPETGVKAAREKSVTVSVAYCGFDAGRSSGSDLRDVKSWFGGEWGIKKEWLEVARLGGGEYMQIVSQKGNIVSAPQPLLAVAWEPTTALRFADYLTGPAARERANMDHVLKTVDRLRTQQTLRSLGIPGTVSAPPAGPLEAGVMRYYEQNPKDATYLIRL